MCKAIEDMVMDGRMEGKREGKREGEAKLAKLISRLFQDGRIADAARAAENSKVRRKLYQEYGI